MAYLATVVISTRKTADGRPLITIQVTETQARDTSEWSTLASATNTVTVDGLAFANGKPFRLPMSGAFTLTQSVRTAGTGTLIQNRFTKATGALAGTANAIGGQSSAQAYVNDANPLRYQYAPGQTPILYGKSVVNSVATDHTIVTLITIEGD